MAIGNLASGPDVAGFKSIFFDRAKVQNAVDRATKRTLSRFGAFVRRRAKSSIKKAPKVDVATGNITRKRKGVELRDAISKPGNPPYGHGEQLLKKFILFGYDQNTKSVVVGPALLRQPAGGATGPEALEYGGTTSVRRPRGRTLTLMIAARPYMRPARDAEMAKFLESIKDSVR